jgi:Tfp pilus assembly protein PilV
MERNHIGRSERRRRDAGVTLIEILISIVLMGGVVAGTMATLRATIMSGAIHRDHSNAHGWLQSASDILYAAPKTACNPLAADKGEAAVRAAYDLVIDSVPNPQNWQDWQIRVVGTVKFWNAANIDADPDIENFFGSGCDPSLALQLIEIEVKSTSGRIIETVSIVK